MKIVPKIYQSKTKVPGENAQVLDLIIRKGNCAQAIWTLFSAELIKVLR